MANATAGTSGVSETDDSVPFLKDAPQISFLSSPPFRIPANQSLRRIFPFPSSFPPVISLRNLQLKIYQWREKRPVVGHCKNDKCDRLYPGGLRDRRLSPILKRCFSNFLPSPAPLRIPANQSLKRISLFPFFQLHFRQ
ncbi:hypothetical protein CEXT_30071 [Caerostris extrusa]|uniref:Uncharacterized protein n=1 Tax=Caerostris extrusa TaxID=172846 RepID=A0AAV4VTJ9_CAEEX|nr:hypothetical protein CEXT_30071 [Caerostris extrusa]